MRSVSIVRKLQFVFVFILGAFVLTACSGHHGDRGGMMFELVSYKLDLTEVQEEKLFAIREEMVRLRKEVKVERKQQLDDVKLLILADVLDQDAVQKRFEMHHDRLRELAPSMIALIAEFHATLTPEQKNKVVGVLDHWASKADKRG